MEIMGSLTKRTKECLNKISKIIFNILLMMMEIIKNGLSIEIFI